MTMALAQPSWHAELALDVTLRRGKNVARPRHRSGPLAFQRSFVADDGACHAYVLHPPGGVVGGDRLRLTVDVHEGARGVVTTPAAQKFYRSPSSEAMVEQTINVGANAGLDFIPLEAIVFNGAHVRTRTELNLDPTSRCTYWDVVAFGRRFSGEGFDDGSLAQRLQVKVDGRMMLLDRLEFEAGSAFARAPWGLAGRNAVGSMLVFPTDEDDVARVRHILTSDEVGEAGASLIENLLIVRARSDQARFIAGTFSEVRGAMFRGTVAARFDKPRIWNT